MKPPGSLISAALLLHSIAHGAASANYTLDPAACDAGGGAAASTNCSTTSSNMAGGTGGSANYAMRAGFAGQLFEASPLSGVLFTVPASLVADGSTKPFAATADGVGDLVLSYQGRDFTDYGKSSAAPSAAGLYRVTASSVSGDFTGSVSRDFVISGPVAVADALTKPRDNSYIAITLSELLGNDFRILPDGSVTSAGLSISGVTSGSGNSAILGEGEDAGWIFFLPSAAQVEAFGYLLNDGVSTANGVVTVTALGTQPSFSLQIVRRGSAAFDGSRTAMSMDFIGVPGQNYQIEWSSDLVTWHSAGTCATGLTGSFTVTFNLEGNHLSSWNQSLFFRAKR